MHKEQAEKILTVLMDINEKCPGLLTKVLLEYVEVPQEVIAAYPELATDPRLETAQISGLGLLNLVLRRTLDAQLIIGVHGHSVTLLSMQPIADEEEETPEQ